MEESIGQQFKAAREAKQVTPSQAAAATRMKLQFVEAMEQDDFTCMAAPAYAKGFIKLYAEYLGLDAAPFIQEYLDKHVEEERSRLVAETPKEESRRVMFEKTKQWAAHVKAIPRERWVWMGKAIVLTLAAAVIVLAVGRGLRSCERAAPKPEPQKQERPLGLLQEPPEPYLDEESPRTE